MRAGAVRRPFPGVTRAPDLQFSAGEVRVVPRFLPDFRRSAGGVVRALDPKTTTTTSRGGVVESCTAPSYRSAVGLAVASCRCLCLSGVRAPSSVARRSFASSGVQR